MTKMFSLEESDEVSAERKKRFWHGVDKGLEKYAKDHDVDIDEARAIIEAVKDADTEMDIEEHIKHDEKIDELNKKIALKQDEEKTASANIHRDYEKLATKNAIQDLFEQWGGLPASFVYALVGIQREAGSKKLEFGMSVGKLVVKNATDKTVLADQDPEVLMKDYLYVNDHWVSPKFDKDLLITDMNTYVKSKFDALEYGLKTGKYRDSNDESYKEELQSTIDLMNAQGEEQARQQAEAATAGKKAFEKLSPAEREKALSGGESAINKAEPLLPGESAEAYARRLGFWDGDQNVAKPAGQ